MNSILDQSILCSAQGKELPNCNVRYTSKKNDANIWNVFPKCACGAACITNWKASSANRKVSSANRKVFSEDTEGFFQRVLGSYTHKFPKRGAALLMDLSELHLCLSELRLWSSELCL